MFEVPVGGTELSLRRSTGDSGVGPKISETPCRVYHFFLFFRRMETRVPGWYTVSKKNLVSLHRSVRFKKQKKTVGGQRKRTQDKYVLVLDLHIAHERFGSTSDPRIFGCLYL